jgi:hypothetical protein
MAAVDLGEFCPGDLAKENLDRVAASRQTDRPFDDPMIYTLLDACQFVLETEGEPQSGLWLASQVEEMKLWRATEDKVRKALKQDIKKFGDSSRFVELSNGEFGLRCWPTK